MVISTETIGSEDHNFNELFWVDQHGIIRTIFMASTPEDTLEKISIAKRDYFKIINGGGGWYLDANPNYRFALQSIKSWLDATYEVGISKPTNMIWNFRGITDTMAVIGLSTKLFSVMDPVLLPGYAFAVVDQKGDVWFHSEKEKNLQENFFEEAGYKPQLISAVKGRMRLAFNMSYTDKNCRALITPIAKWPLYLITYHDLGYRTTAIGQTLTTTFYLLLLLLLLIATHIGLFYLIKRKPSKLKKRPFLFQFLTPHSSKKATIGRINLVLLSVIFLLLILSVFSYYAGDRPYLYSLAPLFIVFISHPYLFAFLYKHLRPEEEKQLANRFVGVTAFLIFAANLLYWYYINMHITFVLLCQGILFMVLWGSSQQPVKPLLTAMAKKYPGTINSYTNFYTLLLIITSFASVHFCYKHTNASEQLLWIKHAHVHVAQRLLAKQDSLRQKLLRSNQALDENGIDSILHSWSYAAGNYYEVGNFMNHVPEPVPASRKRFSVKKFGKPDHRQHNWELLQLFGTPSNTRLIIDTKAFLPDSADDGSWHWCFGSIIIATKLQIKNCNITLWQEEHSQENRS